VNAGSLEACQGLSSCVPLRHSIVVLLRASNFCVGQHMCAFHSERYCLIVAAVRSSYSMHIIRVKHYTNVLNVVVDIFQIVLLILVLYFGVLEWTRLIRNGMSHFTVSRVIQPIPTITCCLPCYLHNVRRQCRRFSNFRNLLIELIAAYFILLCDFLRCRVTSLLDELYL